MEGKGFRLGFDFDIDTRGQRERFERIDGFAGGVEDINEAFMRADFKLFARFAVNVRGTKNSIDFTASGKGNRACHTCASPLCGFDDIRSSPVE